jgi:D-aspartate ligase
MAIVASNYKHYAPVMISVPAVVMKSYDHHGLGVTRSLGRLGIPIYGICPYVRASGFLSRYFIKRIICNVDDQPVEQTVQHLLALGKSIGKKSVLVATSDKSAVLIADFASALKEYFIFPNVSSKLIRSLVDKKGLYFLLKQHGIPTPEAFFPKSRNDVKEYLKQANFSLMLKGIDGHVAKKVSGKRMFITRTNEELLSLYDQFEDFSSPNFMLQEYIEDSTSWMFNGYFNEHSECLFGITGKKIRQHPSKTGVTSLGICINNETIIETTKQFTKKIGYSGPVDVDYLFDKRDGKYKIIDFNPRIGATFRLFVADNDLDVMQAEYLDLTGQQVPASHIVQGRKWIVEDYDVISSLKDVREKKLSFYQWARSLNGVQESAWFARDDLFPFFAMSAVLGRTLTHKTEDSI